jgi:hypothetical protein
MVLTKIIINTVLLRIHFCFKKIKRIFSDCMSFLYYICRKRVIRVNSTEDDVHLVHREMGIGTQTKSVQV